MSKKSVVYQLTLNSACFTSWSSSILFLRLTSGRVYRCDRANLPQPNISRCMFWPSFVPLLRIPCHNQMFGFFWQLPETFSSLLLFDTQTYVVLHHCPRILDILQLTLRCHSLSPQNVSILSHDRTRAARCFFFFLSLSHLQVNVPLSQNVHKSSISWSVLMPGGVAQSPTIHIVCMLSSTLKNNNCVCISKSTHMTFFLFLCSCLDSDIFGRLMC